MTKGLTDPIGQWNKENRKPPFDAETSSCNSAIEFSLDSKSGSKNRDGFNCAVKDNRVNNKRTWDMLRARIFQRRNQGARSTGGGEHPFFFRVASNIYYRAESDT